MWFTKAFLAIASASSSIYASAPISTSESNYFAPHESLDAVDDVRERKKLRGLSTQIISSRKLNVGATCPPADNPWAEIPPAIVTIAKSNANVLCRIILVVGDDQIPVARSYDAGDWYQYSGAFSGLDINCTHDECTFDLAQPAQGGQYMIAATNGYSLSHEQIAARFFEAATFGMTKESISSMAQDMVSTDNAIAMWISEQMNQEATPISSHREFYRKYANGTSTHQLSLKEDSRLRLTIRITY